MVSNLLTGNKAWDDLLLPNLPQGFAQAILSFLETEYASNVVFPPRNQVFRVFRDLNPQDVRVVILGQDPYHNPNEAIGRAFAVDRGQKMPPSLRNILKECGCTYQFDEPDTTLQGWSDQGVMLLNTVLTVRANNPGSHRSLLWEPFTDAVLRCLNQPKPRAFLLWGKDAQSRRNLLDGAGHLVLEAAHPSPLSAYRGFLGCGHFSAVNQWLTARGDRLIDWCA